MTTTTITIESTRVEMTELIHSGNTGGAGDILKWMDICACMSAEKLSKCSSVTASMDDVRFMSELSLGSVAIIRSQVNAAFGSSMEVGCVVYSEDLTTGKSTRVCSAYFTFVSFNSSGEKIRLPKMEAPEEGTNDWRRQMEGCERRKIRLNQCKLLISYADMSANELKRMDADANEVLHDSGHDEEKHAASPSSSPQVKPRRDAKASSSRNIKLIVPNMTNHMGTMFGGESMSLIHDIAYIAASRFTKRRVTLVYIADIFFKTPMRVGDRVQFSSSVNRVFSNTLEVGVRVEHMALNQTDWTHSLTAFLTFRTHSSDLKPFSYDVDAAANEEQERRYHAALARRTLAMSRVAIRKYDKSTAPQWTESNALQLAYANLRGLMAVYNAAVFKRDAWEVVMEKTVGASATPTTMYIQHGQTKNKVVCARIVSTINVPARRVFDFLRRVETRSLWDLGALEHRIVEAQLTDNSDLVYMKRRSAHSDVAQDFCLLRTWRDADVEGGDDFIISSRSVVHPSVTSVNGEVMPSGFVLRSLKDSTSVTYIVQLSAKSVQLVTGEFSGVSQLIMNSFERLKRVLEEGEKK